MEREEIIIELHRVASLLGKQTIAYREFIQYGKVSIKSVERTFGSWNEAIRAAGLAATLSSKEAKLSDESLAAEFHRVEGLLGKAPTENEFEANGHFSIKPYRDRFGTWAKAVEYYTNSSVTQLKVEPKISEQRPFKPTAVKPQTVPSVSGKRVFGAPLNFRELRHEPINEQGVVLLFGMVAREMGFLVEAVAIAYPDCTAKRKVKGGYIAVNIEFEFKSGNFREHGHDPSQCDLIICWEHDWPDCPVEVLELKSKLRELDART